MGAPIGELGCTDHLVYHYTRASTAIERILADLKIRLGPIHDTNDPWEARLQRIWAQSSPEPPTAPEREGPSIVPAASDALDRAMRRVRVACLCRDESTSDPERAQFHARSTCGWARDRMWAQYADAHRGVCLGLDREALLASFRSELESHGRGLAGDVVYGDEQYERGSSPPRVEGAEILGADAYALAYRDQIARHRFFTKRRDWEGEREWRLALYDDNPTGDYAFVNIATALRVIFVSSRFSDAYHPCIKGVCERHGIRAFKVMYSGIVGLSRYDPSPVRPA